MLIKISRGAVTFIPIVSYPMLLFPARAVLDEMIGDCLAWEPAQPGQAPFKRHYGLTLVVFGLSLIVSLAVSDLGKVFEVVGATSCTIMMLLMPGLLLIPKQWEDFRIERFEKHGAEPPEAEYESRTGFGKFLAWLPSISLLTLAVVIIVSSLYVIAT